MAARKVIIDGITFASGAEGRRYLELRLLQDNGVISHLKCHTTHPLQEGFNLPGGKRIRAITWTDDFSYYDVERDEIVVEDVKGFQREANVLRHKLFMYKYKQRITIVRN